MPKIKSNKKAQAQLKVPLHQEIEEAKFAKPKNRNKIRKRKDDDEKVKMS